MKERQPEIVQAQFEGMSPEDREGLSAEQLLALAEAAERKEHDEQWYLEKISEELVRTGAEFKDLRELHFDAVGRHLRQLAELIQSAMPQARMLARVEEASERWDAVTRSAEACEETRNKVEARFAEDKEHLTEETAIGVQETSEKPRCPGVVFRYCPTWREALRLARYEDRTSLTRQAPGRTSKGGPPSRLSAAPASRAERLMSFNVFCAFAQNDHEMKIALVHDHLMQDGGAERVLRALQDVFPGAPTYTLLYRPDRVDAAFRQQDIRTSFLQRLPLATSRYQWLLPLMPSATESHDLSAYDVIVSSSSAFAKGVITKPGALHVCYCHTPTRYLWSDTHSYVQELNAPRVVKAALPVFLNRLRVWDRLSAERVDKFVANSRTVADRIRKYYGRESDVIYPPVEAAKFAVADKPGTYFLAGGRLVSYKRFDMVIQAFNRTGLPLKIFGDGPLYAEYRRMAKPNVEFTGRVDDAAKAELYRGAIAFLNPQEEDFGITAVESMAAGRPVIAYGRGGALETVIEGKTGTLFGEQSWEELAATVIRFDASRYDPAAIRAHALEFDVTAFKRTMAAYVSRAWHASQNVPAYANPSP